MSRPKESRHEERIVRLTHRPKSRRALLKRAARREALREVVA